MNVFRDRRLHVVVTMVLIGAIAVPQRPSPQISLAGDVGSYSPEDPRPVDEVGPDFTSDDASAERVAVEPSTVITAKSGGLSLRATVSPLVVAVGAPVGVRLEATDETDARVRFGHAIDEEPPPRLAPRCEQRVEPAMPRVRTPTPQRRNLVVAFPEAGRHVLTIRARTHRCLTDRSTSVALVVQVLPGRRPSNGPVLPEIRVEGSGGGGRRQVVFYVMAGDKDGFVRDIRVDWGDGSPPAARTWPLGECTSGVEPWPTTDHAMQTSHEYASPGRYEVVVSAVSTGCDGRHRQEVPYRRAVVLEDGR